MSKYGSKYRGRYAPSPTGPLHLGNVFAAYVAWRRCRERGGAFVLRVEDLDAPRVVPGCEADQLKDLAWLGLDWDEGPDVGGPFLPYRQSERLVLYGHAVDALLAQGRAYYCTCSRKQIALASAPHSLGEEGPRYPGTCRGRTRRPSGRYSVRFLVEPEVVVVEDAFAGAYRQNVLQEVGDFVIARADGIFAYQLAVVVDDIAMEIGEVVRGRDLLVSTPRQVLLYRALGAVPPAFAHAPLIVRADRSKVSKRDQTDTLAAWRARPNGQQRLTAALDAAWDRCRAEIVPETIVLSDLLPVVA